MKQAGPLGCQDFVPGPPRGRVALDRYLDPVRKWRHGFPLTKQCRQVVGPRAATRPLYYRARQRARTHADRPANSSIHKERNLFLPRHHASFPAHRRDPQVRPVECVFCLSRTRPGPGKPPNDFGTAWRPFDKRVGAVVTAQRLFHSSIIARCAGAIVCRRHTCLQSVRWSTAVCALRSREDHAKRFPLERGYRPDLGSGN